MAPSFVPAAATPARPGPPGGHRARPGGRTSEAAILAGAPLDILARHGRSFRWAGAFLGETALRDAAQLYAFCRAVDDIADEADDPRAARARLERVARGLADPALGDPVAALFHDLRARRPVDPGAARDLVRTLAGDVGPVALPDRRALLRYAYGAAGTVGLMMRPLLGATDPRAAPFAVDLGIAMQLTNIARDVREDAEAGRLYLPAADLPPGIDAARVAAGEPAARAAAHAAALRLLDLAARHYRSADAGFAYIPPRPRLAIRIAARLYESIGDRIRRLPPEIYWRRRTATSRAAKTRLTLAAARVSAREALRAASPTPPEHDAALHAALDGLGPRDGARR